MAGSSGGSGKEDVDARHVCGQVMAKAKRGGGRRGTVENRDHLDQGLKGGPDRVNLDNSEQPVC